MQQKTATLMQERNAGSIKGPLTDTLRRSEDIKVGFLEEATVDLSVSNKLVLGRQWKGLKFQVQKRWYTKPQRWERKKQYVWRIIGSLLLMDHKNMNTERLKRGDKGGMEAAGKGWLYTMFEFRLWPQRIIMYTKIF